MKQKSHTHKEDIRIRSGHQPRPQALTDRDGARFSRRVRRQTSHMIFRRGRLGTRLSKFVRKDGSAARQRRDGSACIHRLTESVRFVFFDRYVHFIRDH